MVAGSALLRLNPLLRARPGRFQNQLRISNLPPTEPPDKFRSHSRSLTVSRSPTRALLPGRVRQIAASHRIRPWLPLQTRQKSPHRVLATMTRNSVANLFRAGSSWIIVLFLPPLLVRVMDKPGLRRLAAPAAIGRLYYVLRQRNPDSHHARYVARSDASRPATILPACLAALEQSLSPPLLSRFCLPPSCPGISPASSRRFQRPPHQARGKRCSSSEPRSP